MSLEIDKKMLRKEKSFVELCGVLLGLPLWLGLAGMLLLSGLYVRLGRLPLLVFYGDEANMLFVLISFPGSVGVAIGLALGATMSAMKSHNPMPLKIFAADSIDFFLGMNLITVLTGLILHYTFY